MADRGFTCDEYARMAMAEIETPPFTKGKKQLEKVNVDWSRELSVVRIHVERVIGVLKQKYTILQSILPIALLSDSKGTVDKSMLCICESLSFCCSTRIIFLNTLIISFSACRQLVIISLNNMYNRYYNGDYAFFFLQSLDSLRQEG